MYNITPEALAYIRAGGLQQIEIKVERTDTQTPLTLTEKDIQGGGFVLDRYSVTGSKAEVGNASAAELSITLENSDGRFDAVRFEGAVLYPKVKIPVAAGFELIPLGVFTVDTPPRKLASVTLKALDRMVRFDKPYPKTTWQNRTLLAVIEDCCNICNVSFAVSESSLLNSARLISKSPKADNLTYRQVLMWAAELCGTNAWMDWDGRLRLTWYGSSSAADITAADRYASDLQEQNSRITGVRIIGNDEETTEYVSGTTTNPIHIEGNLLVHSGIQAIATTLGGRLTNWTYRPFSCETNALPHIWPMDRVTYRDKSNAAITTYITHHNFTLNGRSKLSAKGETDHAASYAAMSPLTAQQRAILARMDNSYQRQFDSMEQATLALNEVIANSMGLYTSNVTNADGSVTTYTHDKPTLAASAYIYVKNAGGYAWTKNGWNNGNPTWNYGVDRDGNAVMRALNAYKITAEQIHLGAADKNYIGKWDLENWEDITAPVGASAWSAMDNPPSPVGGITNARFFYSSAESHHSLYAPRTEAFRVAAGEVYVYTGWFKANSAGKDVGLRLRITNEHGIGGDYYTPTQWVTCAGSNKWTSFAVKIKIPDTGNWQYARALIYGRSYTSGNVRYACTGFELRRASRGEMIVDGVITSPDGITYFDVANGEIAVAGTDRKMVLYDATSTAAGDADPYLQQQGIIWVPKNTTVSSITNIRDAARTFIIENVFRSGEVTLSIRSQNLIVLDAATMAATGNINAQGYIKAAGDIEAAGKITAGNSVTIPNGRSVGGITTDEAREAMLQKSTSNNTVLGDSTQVGNTHIYAGAGQRINFYLGGTRAGYIDASGWHNG